MGRFLYLARKRDSLSNEEKLSLFKFEYEITSLCNKYCTIGARVLPALSNVEEVVALVDTPLGIVDGSYIVPYMMPEKEEDEYIKACARHEFVHIFLKEHLDVKKNIINDICPQLQVMVQRDDAFKAFLYREMPYLYDSLCNYMDEKLKIRKRLVGAEEVICELATCNESPVAKEVFNMILSGNWSVKDLYYIFIKLAISKL